MVNKKFWLGILVMVLIFGMTVVPKNIVSSKILMKYGFTKINHEYNDQRDMYELKL